MQISHSHYFVLDLFRNVPPVLYRASAPWWSRIPNGSTPESFSGTITLSKIENQHPTYIHLCNVKDSSAHYELEYDRWEARVSKEGESYAVDCRDSLTMAGVCGSSEHEAVNQNLIFGSELA